MAVNYSKDEIVTLWEGMEHCIKAIAFLRKKQKEILKRVEVLENEKK